MMTMSARTGFARMAAVALSLSGLTSVALANDRWMPAVGEAAILLPDPVSAKGVAGATLSCAEQQWRLGLQLRPDVLLLPGPTSATLDVSGQAFPVEASVEPGKVVLPIDAPALAVLKSGTRAQVVVGGPAAALEATFGLRGSRLAIDAAAPLCSKRDMSQYETVAFTPYSSHLLEAKELRKAEIEVFRAATAADPVVSASKTVMKDGRSLLFVQLCGSSWYYGASGCNVAVFARLSDSAEWEQVYDAEGADLYLDSRRLVDGWPSIIALPKVGGEEVLWAWGGDGYAVVENSAVAAVPAEAEGSQ